MKQHFYRKLLGITFLALISGNLTFAQTGGITGVVTDADNNEPLIGATVAIQGTSNGVATDLDGRFLFQGLAPGTYSLEIRYVSYQNKNMAGITVVGGKDTEVNVSLNVEGITTETVVITAEATRQSAASVINLTQKTTAIVTGITSEDIKKSPDRNTSDVLKRVSGTSIQDGKFVVIRGLSDRYNASTINGLSLPSTEPDRRAFSFDLFPSSMLDNLVIYKTATADLPGEFGGGVISLNTKEIPESKFVQASIGGSFNSVSTFKPYRSYNGSNTDWLGFDGGTRQLSSSAPAVFDGTRDNPNRFTESQKVVSDWSYFQKSSMMPSFTAQVSAGNRWRFGKESAFGLTGGLNYSNQQRRVDVAVNDYDNAGQLQGFADQRSRQTITSSALLNGGIFINATNRIMVNNIFSVTGEDQFTYRTGQTNLQGGGNPIFQNSMQYQSTYLLNNQVLGEHATTNGAFKVKWAASYSRVFRDVPNLRRALYILTDNDDDGVFQTEASLGNANQVLPSSFGMLYNNQSENVYSAHNDYSYNVNLTQGHKAVIKAGGFLNFKVKDFNARQLGINMANQNAFNGSLRLLTQDQMLSGANFQDQTGFSVFEYRSAFNNFSGTSSVNGGYALVEYSWAKHLKIVAGVRAEKFDLKLLNGLGEEKANLNTLDILPSAAIIYSAIPDKLNFRLAASKTVARPNMRELAPFQFYDFNQAAIVSGNPALKTTNIRNLDLRTEWFPAPGQMIAVTGFFKDFERPIEYTFDPGQQPRNFSYEYVDNSQCYGIELEARLKLSPLRYLLDWNGFDNITFATNLTYIDSRTNLDRIIDANTRAAFNTSPMLQGQSPFIANVSLNYTVKEWGTSFTALYNQIGRRIVQRGLNIRDVWENSRPVFDFQISQQIGKKGELKFNIGDLLNKPVVYYMDNDNNGDFNEDKDYTFLNYANGTNYSLTFTWKL